MAVLPQLTRCILFNRKCLTENQLVWGKKDILVPRNLSQKNDSYIIFLWLTGVYCPSHKKRKRNFVKSSIRTSTNEKTCSSTGHLTKGYGLLNILFRSTFSLQYGHICFFPTMHQPRMQNSWNLGCEVKGDQTLTGIGIVNQDDLLYEVERFDQLNGATSKSIQSMPLPSGEWNTSALCSLRNSWYS